MARFGREVRATLGGGVGILFSSGSGSVISPAFGSDFAISLAFAHRPTTKMAMPQKKCSNRILQSQRVASTLRMYKKRRSARTSPVHVEISISHWWFHSFVLSGKIQRIGSALRLVIFLL